MNKEEREKFLTENWDAMTYKELAEGCGFKHPDSVRKWGARNGMPHKCLNSQAIPRNIEHEVTEERRDLHYRQQINILSRKNKELMKSANLQEELLAIARESVEALPRVSAPNILKTKTRVIEEVCILDLSDLHIGEVIKGDELGWLNSYDFEVMCKRLAKASDSVADIHSALQGYSLKKLYVNALGDFITGIIHQELVENSDSNVFDWVFNGALVVSQFLSELLTVFDEIEFTGVVGNHGRLQKEVRFKARYVNWDYFFYQTVALMMRDNPRIHFDLPRSFWTVKNIGGRNALLLHGDNIKSWQGIPWYGIQRAASRLGELLSSKDIFFDDIHIAHFHNDGTLRRARGEMFINGSVVGGNEFSIGAMFSSSDPYQWLIGVNPKHKRCTWRFPLDLRENGDKVRYKYGKHLVVADQLSELF
jgi:hypothetical protein